MSNVVAEDALSAGQRWTFDATHGFDDARIIIGAIVSTGSSERIVCFSVTRAPTTLEGGAHGETAISFIPMSESAFKKTVKMCEGTGDPVENFTAELQAWQNDPRGLAVFTVPFDGCLDRLLANQAASLINTATSAA